jgi:hypothetical protein
MDLQKRPTYQSYLSDDLASPALPGLKGFGLVYIRVAIPPVRNIPVLNCLEFG